MRRWTLDRESQRVLCDGIDYLDPLQWDEDVAQFVADACNAAEERRAMAEAIPRIIEEARRAQDRYAARVSVRGEIDEVGT